MSAMLGLGIGSNYPLPEERAVGYVNQTGSFFDSLKKIADSPAARALATKVANTAFNTITYMVVVPEKIMEITTTTNKNHLSTSPKGELLSHFLSLLADKLSSSQFFIDGAKETIQSYFSKDSTVGSYSGLAVATALSQNKDYVSLLIKSILTQALANLATAAERHNNKAEVDLLSLCSFFISKIEMECAQIGLVHNVTIEDVADNILETLFPNKSDDFPIAEGMFTRYFDFKNFIWQGMRSSLIWFIHQKMNTEATQTRFMCNTSHEERISGKKLSSDIVHQIFDVISEESISTNILSYLDKEGTDQEFAKLLRSEIGNFVSKDRQEVTAFKEILTIFLTPTCIHIQKNNVLNREPKDHTLIYLLDDILGVCARAYNLVSDGNNQGYQIAAHEMLEVLHAHEPHTMPFGELLTEFVRTQIRAHIPKIMEENSTLGGTEAVVRKAYQETLERFVGEDNCALYLIGCGAISEMLTKNVVEAITKKDAAEDIVTYSNIRNLIDYFLLQALVNTFVNAGVETPEGKVSSVTHVLEKFGQIIAEFHGENADKIQAIVNSDQEQTIKQKALETIFSDLTIQLVQQTTIKSEWENGSPYNMVFNKLVKSQLDAVAFVISKELAKLFLDVTVLAPNSEHIMDELTSIPREMYVKDGEGNFVEDDTHNRFKAKNEETFVQLIAKLSEGIVAAFPKLVTDSKQIDEVFKAIESAIIVSNSEDAQEMSALMKDQNAKICFKQKLEAFLESHPSVMGFVGPLLKTYFDQFFAKAIQPLLSSVQSAENVPGKKLFREIALKVLDNINDHFYAIDQIRMSLGKNWAQEVSHRQYITYFLEGALGSSEETAKKILSDKTPQSEAVLEALELVKEDKKLIKRQQKLLKAAKTNEEKQACITEIQRLRKNVKSNEKIIQDERCSRLEPMISKIIQIMELDKENETPLPTDYRKSFVESLRKQGAAGMASAIASTLSRERIDAALTSAFISYNANYYKTKEEVQVDHRISLANRRNIENVQVNGQAHQNFFWRYINHLKRSHAVYFPVTTEGEVPANPMEIDQTLRDVCASVVHRITRLVPHSIIKTAFGFESIQNIGGDFFGELLQKPLNDDQTVLSTLDDLLESTVKDILKSLDDVTEAEEHDDEVEVPKTLEELVEMELQALDVEEKRHKKMISAGRYTAMHIYLDVFLSSIRSCFNAIDKTVDALLLHRSQDVKRFLRKIYLAALFDMIGYALSWTSVPFIMLVETWLRIVPLRRSKAENVLELLHLDINENLIDTVLETIVNEMVKVKGT